MGMFDTVLPECELPGSPPTAARISWWQTKTFEWPGLDRYRITAEGRLMEEVYHIEDRSDPTLPEDTLARLRGCMTRVHEGWRDMNFDGVLNFYALIDDGWWEYNATFAEGHLVSIERVFSHCEDVV
jgi:hypothetical protein